MLGEEEIAILSEVRQLKDETTKTNNLIIATASQLSLVQQTHYQVIELKKEFEDIRKRLELKDNEINVLKQENAGLKQSLGNMVAMVDFIPIKNKLDSTDELARKTNKVVSDNNGQSLTIRISSLEQKQVDNISKREILEQQLAASMTEVQGRFNKHSLYNGVITTILTAVAIAISVIKK